jgi:hypothetical protein
MQISADSVSRFTETLCTPGTAAMFCSTLPTQLAQLMPPIINLTRANVATRDVVICSIGCVQMRAASGLFFKLQASKSRLDGAC